MTKITQVLNDGDVVNEGHFQQIKDVVNANDDIATPLSVAYSTTVKADRRRFKAKHTMTGAVALTLDTTGAILGLGETIPFVGDGNNIIISGGTIVPSQNATIATEAGVELLLVLVYSGSYWQVGIEGANSIAPTSIIDMQDDFAGTTIDLAKWTKTDLDGYLSQNEKLIWSYNGIASSREHYLTSIINAATIAAIQVTKANNTNFHVSWFQFWDGTQQNEITIGGQVADRALVRLLIRKGDVSVYDENIAISNDNTFKILKDGDNISFWYLSAPNVWTIMNPTGSPEVVTGMPTLKAGLIGSSTTNVGTADVDNFYLTHADYSTSVPV